MLFKIQKECAHFLNNNFNNNKIFREKKEMALDLVIDLNDIIDDTYVKKFDDHTSKLLQKKC